MDRALPPIEYRRRLIELRQRMRQTGTPALLLAKPADVRYLCGFTGSSAMLAVTARRAAMFTDGRYIAQAREETEGARVVITKHAARSACEWLARAEVDGCGYDPASTTVAELDRMRGLYRSTADRRAGKFFRPLRFPLLSELRLVKDDAELRRMESAAQLGSELFDFILPFLRPGIPETEVAGRLELEARMRGAEGMSFETIVAAGTRSSMPHGKATSCRLPRRGFVTLDFGVILNGYCSDMTRTVFLGRASKAERLAYEAVLRAERSAISSVKSGVAAGDVDEAARSVLRRADLGKYFTHSTGHGVGLEIHEDPRIASSEKRPLAAGMVITIEPGVYMPGKFGIRIEDMVVVTEDGARLLTSAPTDWMEIRAGDEPEA